MALLEGKIALVTGGASGIGLATAKALADQGAVVWICDLNGPAANSVADQISRGGGKAQAFVLDVSSVVENDRLFAEIEAVSGRLDIAVLNAGFARGSRIYDGSVEDFDLHIAVMLRGVFLGMRKAAPLMHKSGGGSIVITSSTAGLSGQGMPGYCAAKHGVVGLSKSGAVELAQYGIRVNAVCPGFTNTPILGDGFNNSALQDSVMRGHSLLNRVADPSEIADSIVFLAGPRAAFITGVALPIDGGMLANPDTPHQMDDAAWQLHLDSLEAENQHIAEPRRESVPAADPVSG